MAVETPYVLDNDRNTASPMLDHLSAILDDFTIARLLTAGVTEGTRCWEAAAGNGSIAAWLGEQVGPQGEVLATDLKPQHVRAHPRVQAVRHNDEDEPALPGVFDLIHARLAFAHWPNRWAVVDKFAGALGPGKALVIEDWGQWSGIVLSSPVPDAAGVYARYQAALMEVFAQAGNDRTWAARTGQAMAEAGLVDIDTVAHAHSWRGGTAGCLLPVVVSRELRAPLLQVGARAEDLDALPEMLANPETYLLGNVMLSTIGRAPMQRV
jgi:SAM-dependent methyltransferase